MRETTSKLGKVEILRETLGGLIPDAAATPDDLDEYDEVMKLGAWEAYNSLVKQEIIKP